MDNQIAVLRAAMQADVPVLLWGAPGTGKTATIATLAKQRAVHMEVLIGSTMDPTDLGYLVPREDRLEVLPPAWAVRLREALDRGQQALLFLDELSTAPPSVQAALLRVVNERQVGPVDLTGCRMVAAANPTEEAAGAAMDLAAASANRWLHVAWHVDVAAWRNGMVNGWGAEQSPAVAAARRLVASYVAARGYSTLVDVPGRVADQGRGWPSPRSWDRLAAVLGALDTAGGPQAAAASPVGHAAAVGLVGHGHAAEFMAWCRDLELPDPEDVLAGRAQLPKRGDLLAAALSGMISAVEADHPDQEARIGQALTVLSGQRLDVAIPFASTLIRKLDADQRRRLPREATQLLAEAVRKLREG